ncbi:hypothetical protein [Enterococcus faecium]|uniref:hypothetical protein n=1 Tax=Enterococcus faecium TaxID=1352 RepID=UPI0019228938|nr:hypothetical protein [Enterococcus faecium]
MFLIWLGLLPQMQAFKHRLSRGCENCAMLRVVRMMGRKQPYISLSKVKISKRIELDFLSQVLSFYYRIQRKSP